MPTTIRNRFKIVYLIFIIIFVGTAIALVYISSSRYFDYQNSLSAYDKLRQHTKLIHLIQKERGFSSTYIHDASKLNKANLESSRNNTTQYIDSVFIETFANAKNTIESIRFDIDSQPINADYAILNYSKLIYSLISQISSQALLVNKKYNHAFFQLQNLIMAREHLGRLRVYISTHYTNLQQDRLIKFYALERYNFYQIAIDEFFNSTFSQNVITRFENSNTLSVLKSIIDALKNNSEAYFDKTEAFSALTEIIDYYYDVEEHLLANIENDLRSDKSQTIFVFFSITIITISFIFLSAFIIFKYLNSLTTRLAELHKKMNSVLETKNYQIEFNDAGQDEISKISGELRSLLQFTHQLIIEKDKMAAHDQLTGIYNRNKFIEVFSLELNKAIRYNTTFCIIMMDIDHFKKINDTYGHGVGDEVLRELALLITQNIRISDIFARWGGEEFVLLTPSSNLEDTKDLAEKLRRIIAAHSFPSGLNITMSFGVTDFEPKDTLESIMNRADTALYKSKHEGRNKVTCSS